MLENHRHRLVSSRNTLRIIDEQSAERVRLGLSNQKGLGVFPWLSLKDTGGRSRVRLMAPDSGPSMTLRDAAGVNRVDLFAIDDMEGIDLRTPTDRRRQIRVPTTAPAAVAPAAPVKSPRRQSGTRNRSMNVSVVSTSRGSMKTSTTGCAMCGGTVP